jgi:adenine-specific DNA-methyltransferase
MVFKLDSSNIKKWNVGADLKATILDYQDNLKTDRRRTDLDVVYENNLKMGLPLTSSVNTHEVNNRKIFSISSGSLMICLDDIVDTDVATEMVELYKRENPNEEDRTVWKVVFKDGGFSDDSVKANTKETLKAGGLQDGSFVTL